MKFFVANSIILNASKFWWFFSKLAEIWFVILGLHKIIESAPQIFLSIQILVSK